MSSGRVRKGGILAGNVGAAVLRGCGIRFCIFGFGITGARDMKKLTQQQREQLQQDIITHCDGLPSELIAKLCEVVANFPVIQGGFTR